MNNRSEERCPFGHWGARSEFHTDAPSFLSRSSLLAPRSFLCLVIVVLSCLNVGTAHAAEMTTSGDIRAATNFAGGMGFCAVKQDAKSADCKTQITYCDANKWIDFVNSNVEFIGGGVPQQKKGLVVDGTLLPDTIYTYLRKDLRNRSRIVPLGESACFCACANGDSEKVCADKPAGTPYQTQVGILFTKEECVRACGSHSIAQKCAGALPAIEVVDIGSAEGAAAARASTAATDDQDMCFTTDECTQQKGIFEADTRKICSGGKGRCVAQDIEVPLNTPIGNVTSIAGIGNYIAILFRYALSILVVITTVMFVWGAFLYLLGSGNIGSIEKGRSIMKDAIIGMILVLSSVLILRTLNPATVDLTKLKVYMINARRFISAAYCRDLAGTDLLADAGVPPSLKPFDEISKAPGAFSVTKENTECGHSYYIQGSIGGACTGTFCQSKGESCISCASGEPTECAGIKSSRMVCDKMNVGGTIAYQDGFYPKKVYLIFACNWAQGKTVDDIKGSLKEIHVDTNVTALISGSSQSDTDTSGQASFKIQLSEDAIAGAVSFCQDKGGFRGALLGVKYNNPGIHATEALVIDAVLSKGNCSGNTFDGYSNDLAAAETTRLADAIDCGINRRKPPRFINPSMDYWSQDELSAAADGRRPISCNFTLDSSGSSDNVAKMCPDQ